MHRPPVGQYKRRCVSLRYGRVAIKKHREALEKASSTLVSKLTLGLAFLRLWTRQLHLTRAIRPIARSAVVVLANDRLARNACIHRNTRSLKEITN